MIWPTTMCVLAFGFNQSTDGCGSCFSSMPAQAHSLPLFRKPSSKVNSPQDFHAENLRGTTATMIESLFRSPPTPDSENYERLPKTMSLMDDSTFRDSAGSMNGFTRNPSGLHMRGRREGYRLGTMMKKIKSLIPMYPWMMASRCPQPNHSPNSSGQQAH